MFRTHRMALCTIALCIVALWTMNAWSATEKVLHNFSGKSDGGSPVSALIFDSSGNLYGTTSAGGKFGFGTAFELTLVNGQWREKVLHNFAGYPHDGSDPESSLVFDQAGNLYGTTASGGPHSCGTVFELTPTANGWTETVLHGFGCCNGDGLEPVSAVFLASNGDIYGTTLFGGTGTGCLGRAPGCGTFFELSKSGGTWTETVLHSFAGVPDAALPWGNLVRDQEGNFYDTSIWGGNSNCADGCGTIFELSPRSNGSWTSTVLYAPDGLTPGTGPIGGLIFDKAGNMYGSFNSDGVFELSPSSGGWTETTIYSFKGGRDGSQPQSGVIMSPSGRLYGTTFWGGGGDCPTGCGTVFGLHPSTSVPWPERVMYRFRNGTGPSGGLVLDRAGNLFGTTVNGGAFGFGVVYEIIP
jgi:uncharacterized repeat protein (TIGR03803 family)